MWRSLSVVVDAMRYFDTKGNNITFNARFGALCFTEEKFPGAVYMTLVLSVYATHS